MCGRCGLLAFPGCSLQQVWTMLERTKPPFRADQVGSLIRPSSLVAARQAAGRGEIAAAELRRIQKEAIRSVVRMQEDVRLKPITDGEYRAYPDMAEFYAELARVYAEEIDDLGEAGCRYLQIDEVNFAYLCDPALRAEVANIGEDPDSVAAI